MGSSEENRTMQGWTLQIEGDKGKEKTDSQNLDEFLPLHPDFILSLMWTNDRRSLKILLLALSDRALGNHSGRGCKGVIGLKYTVGFKVFLKP